MSTFLHLGTEHGILTLRKNSGGQFVLANLNRRVREVLELTRGERHSPRDLQGQPGGGRQNPLDSLEDDVARFDLAGNRRPVHAQGQPLCRTNRLGPRLDNEWNLEGPFGPNAPGH